MNALAAGAAPAWMTARVAGVDFAIAIETVGEVLPAPALAPVPLVPAWVAGIVGVRGDVVTVVDPAMRLFGRPARRDGRLVLTAADEAGDRVGVLVDAVTGLVDRRAGSVESRTEAAAAPADTVPLRFAPTAVLRSAGDSLPVLDLGALLDPDVASAVAGD